jgi:hypothetical protein
MKTIFAAFAAVALLTLPLLPGGAEQQSATTIKVDKDQIDFLVGKEIVTSYHVKKDLPRPFLWPLNAPGGVPTTRDWPMGKQLPGEEIDHPHQRSAWFTYGDVIPEGMTLKTKIKGIEGIDFWTEGKGRGKIVCTKVDEPKTSPAGPSITTHNEWLTPEGEKIMDETRTISLVSVAKGYLIVLDIDLIASVCPITFGDTKEGAMAVRVHTGLTVKMGKGKLQNADNKVGEKACWGFTSPWCDYSGKVGGTMVGVAILDDPANRYPSCWHAREYGLMAANCFGRDKGAKFPGMKGNNERVRLAKGDHLPLRYGLFVHTGDAADGQVAAGFEQFVKLRPAAKK